MEYCHAVLYAALSIRLNIKWLLCSDAVWADCGQQLACHNGKLKVLYLFVINLVLTELKSLKAAKLKFKMWHLRKERYVTET